MLINERVPAWRPDSEIVETWKVGRSDFDIVETLKMRQIVFAAM
jgi:hypothetical protein